MLVLSRQRAETIMIGDDVEITVVDIRGDKVRIGITAPREIQVHRKEVYDAIKRENQQAAKLRPRDVSDVVEREPQNNNVGKAALDLGKKEDEKREPLTDSPDAAKNKPEQKLDQSKELNDPHRSNQVRRSH